MFKRAFLFIAVMIALTCAPAMAGPAGGEPPAPDAATQIIERLEARYGGKDFSADFQQESTLKAMEITDSAKGKAWFKHPGKMRWEYQSPEKYMIISGGENLWIYRPADNQVVTGDARDYFGNGKGASFLSNFRLLKEAFTVSVESQIGTEYQLKLIPLEKQYDLSAIYLAADKETLDIAYVISENVYGDITRISFSNLTFHDALEESLFTFKIPPGTDVVRMDEGTK